MFWKNNSPKEVSTKDVGLESKFYSFGQNATADAQIKKDEAKFEKLVCALRDEDKPCLSNPLIPELMTIFEVRTRHFRERCFSQSEIALDYYVDLIFRDKDKFERLYRKNQEEYMPWLKENNPEYWSRLQQLDSEERMKIELAIIDDLRSKSPEVVMKAKEKVYQEMKVWIKSEHLKILRQPISDNLRVNHFKNLAYTILQTHSPLVLGDSLILFCVNQYQYKPFLNEEDVLNAVYLPLTPRKVLVGVQPGSNAPSTNLPGTIARCSLEFFIGATNSKETRRLQKIIGKDVLHLVRIDMEATLDRISN